MDEIKNSFIEDDVDIYNKPTKSIPKPEPNIGIDVQDSLFDNIIEAGENSQLDISQINSFTQISQNRNELYNLYDVMGEDTTIASALEIYTSDIVQQNQDGNIVWAESDDPNIAKYINYLLNILNIDKKIYKWAYSLCKYGDVYIRLYRNSDLNDSKKDSKLNEDIKIKAYSTNDKYANYIEMVSNPANMFELTRFGKTCGYINAASLNAIKKNENVFNSYYTYKFNNSDIFIYDATEFVHIALEEDSYREQETVDLYLDADKDDKITYTVRRGQSILYNIYKIWRELELLETSVLLSRITKSSIIRIIGVEVGDMPKEKVQIKLRHVKQLMEQKTALTDKTSMTEYTNPGPIENNIYVPIRNGQGNITAANIGGEYDPKSLTDLEYYRDKLFGGLRIPKQLAGFTDDSTGFNGGSSLTLISSRYAKEIKKLQSIIIQGITDIINLNLIDKGLNSYLNKFIIKITPPITQEDVDRQETLSNKINSMQDIMNLISSVDEDVTQLKILKNLLSSVVDQDIISIIQDKIDLIEVQQNIDNIQQNINDEEIITPNRDISIQQDISMDNSDQSDIDSNLDDNDLILPRPSQLDTDLN